MCAFTCQATELATSTRPLRPFRAQRGGKLVAQHAFDLDHRWAFWPKLAFQACDLAADEAAGNDVGEVCEVGGDVEGQPVHGDPAAHTHAHRGDFAGLLIRC